jgi:hypothetical protein
MSETWAAMEALVERGLVRAIGVSNFSAKKLEEVLSYARIAPAVNQVGVPLRIVCRPPPLPFRSATASEPPPCAAMRRGHGSSPYAALWLAL